MSLGLIPWMRFICKVSHNQFTRLCFRLYSFDVRTLISPFLKQGNVTCTALTSVTRLCIIFKGGLAGTPLKWGYEPIVCSRKFWDMVTIISKLGGTCDFIYMRQHFMNDILALRFSDSFALSTSPTNSIYFTLYFHICWFGFFLT